MIGVYVAAPLASKCRAAWIVGELRAAGVRVCSTWHRRVPAGQVGDPTDKATRREVLCANRSELRMAGLLVALTDERGGRSTYVEIGEAIAMGLPIVWSVERGGVSLYEADPLVVSVASDDGVRAAVLALVRVSDGAVGVAQAAAVA